MAIKPRNRAQTVSDLISAARAQLEHTAYEQVRTRDIAEEAGCTHGLITQYFGSKLGLYTQVLQDIAAEINDLISNGLSVDQLVTYPLSSTYWRLLAALMTAGLDPADALIDGKPAIETMVRRGSEMVGRDLSELRDIAGLLILMVGGYHMFGPALTSTLSSSSEPQDAAIALRRTVDLLLRGLTQE